MPPWAIRKYKMTDSSMFARRAIDGNKNGKMGYPQIKDPCIWLSTPKGYQRDVVSSPGKREDMGENGTS